MSRSSKPLLTLRRSALLCLPLAAIAVAVLAFAWTSSGTDQVQAADPGAMNLTTANVASSGGACDDTKCSVVIGTNFNLEVEITKAPVVGYIGLGTEVDIARLTYNPKQLFSTELVWPDLAGLFTRFATAGVINHGVGTSDLEPFPVSEFAGTILRLNLTCTAAKSSQAINLVPFNAVANTNGSGFKLNATTSVSVAADSMTINCVNPPPRTETRTPTDTPEFPSFEKVPDLQNLFLTRQGAKIPPANCKASTDTAAAVMQLSSPLAVAPDPKDPNLNQELGAFEFQVKYDEDKVCLDLDAGPAAIAMTCFIQDENNSQLEGVARIGCVTLGKNTFPNTADPLQRVLAILTIRPQPNEYSIIKPNQDNGNTTQILNVGCSLSDLQGHPMFFIGGCPGTDVTIRYLEGDVIPDCQVNALDAAAIAARWGAIKGNLLYDDFMNVEPTIPPDKDIDIYDIQFVFGRFGSTCGNPHPPQDPVNPKA